MPQFVGALLGQHNVLGVLEGEPRGVFFASVPCTPTPADAMHFGLRPLAAG
jgi:hypothetical protein